MTTESCNCIVCAEEFDVKELASNSSSINTSMFKICQSCIDKSDPTDDYNQARTIINSYVKATEVKTLFKEAKDIIASLKK